MPPTHAPYSIEVKIIQPPPPAYGKYDLVSHGTSAAGRNECYTVFKDNDGSKPGWGPGYENSCMHSGFIKTSGDLSTIWYSYSLATAGTIVDINTSSESPAINTAKAKESVCPKGWTLPNNIQINSNRNIISFSPVLGGVYYNRTLYDESVRGFWWGSEANSDTRRYSSRYDGSSLGIGYGTRPTGHYIRCVQKS